MTKTYVLDTNVLLSDPLSFYAFEDNDVVIPTIVLQEIDNKKTYMDVIGKNARDFSKQIDSLRETGKLHEGVDLRVGGKLFVKSHPSESEVYDNFLDNSPDNKIISVALELQKEGRNVVIVSRDVLVRVKSDACGIIAEDYKHDKVISADSTQYEGYKTIDLDYERFDEFYKTNQTILDQDLNENELVLMKNPEGNSAIGISKRKRVVPLYHYDEEKEIFGLKGKNLEQRLALEVLLDDSIPLVTLSGKAGTGKTLLALAVALHKTMDMQQYTKISVARPNVQMGKEHGFLTGDLQEKLKPLMQPVFDNLEFLFNCKSKEELEKLMSGYEEVIEVEALSYIRGRSIPNQFIIIDEAQNLNQHEAKTILTRVGENSKIVLVGDPEQIDNPYLDAYNNGLTYVIEKMKNLKESAHVTLKNGERSTLAQICADIL